MGRSRDSRDSVEITFPQPRGSQEELLTTKQAAQLLQLQESTLEQWRWQGTGPVFAKLGRLVRYRRMDLEAFVAVRVFASTTAAQEG